MKPLVIITLCVVYLLPFKVFAQDQVNPDQPDKPRLTEKVIIKESNFESSQIADEAPDHVITTNARPKPGPVMHTASLPKSTLEEQILKFERQLEGLSAEYKKANPEIVKNLEMIIRRKKSEKALRAKTTETTPSN